MVAVPRPALNGPAMTALPRCMRPVPMSMMTRPPERPWIETHAVLPP